ncbi:MAG: hypothetical protein RJB13_1564, partial [Pseudomonadota bacterium]
MKFTTLESFSKHLSDSVNLSALNRVPADRKTLDFAWLTWQLDWLYSYPELLSASAKNNIQHYWASAPELITLADQIRIDWVAEYGFSWQNHGSNQPRNSVTNTLMKILTQYIPNAASPSERIRDYLVSYAGLPEEKWKDISQWKLASQEHVVISKRAHLRSVESYHWLSNQELKQVLLQRPVGEQLIQTGNLNIIPLPEHLPRPASFSLPDGSLWLAWPQKARPTHLHPIVQASLVCHEAAHLVQNHMPPSRLQTGHDSIWQSEKAALQEEW